MDLDRYVVTGADLVPRRLERFLGARSDVHGTAFRRKAHGAGEADAAAAAGDQHGAAGKFHVHVAIS